MDPLGKINVHTIDLRSELQYDFTSLFHNEIYSSDIGAEKLGTHNFFCIYRIVEGNGIHRVKNQVIPCKAGDVHIVRAHAHHGFFLMNERDGLVIDQLVLHINDWFSGEIGNIESLRFCYGIFEGDVQVACARLNKSTSAEVSRLFTCIEREARERRAEWNDLIVSYLTELLITLSRYIGSSVKNVPPSSSVRRGVVFSAMQIIKEEYFKKTLTLDTVAELLYISPSRLSRSFKRATGKPISEYLRDIRMENACRLLEESALTVEKIVDACGMCDVPTFYRNFYHRMQMTPRQYRQATRAKKANANSDSQASAAINILHGISEGLQNGMANTVKELVQQALDRGIASRRILDEGLLAGMNVVGEKFKSGASCVPEVLVASRAMNAGMQMLKPALQEATSKALGRAVIGTVQGDLHDIGKNLVKMMMEGRGIEVIDLGVDVAAETFVEAAIEKECRLICCSALLSTTMDVMADVVRIAERAGIRDKVKILIGGAPVTQVFCDSIGADQYAPDAVSAVEAAVTLLTAFDNV